MNKIVLGCFGTALFAGGVRLGCVLQKLCDEKVLKNIKMKHQEFIKQMNN